MIYEVWTMKCRFNKSEMWSVISEVWSPLWAFVQSRPQILKNLFTLRIICTLFPAQFLWFILINVMVRTMRIHTYGCNYKKSNHLSRECIRNNVNMHMKCWTVDHELSTWTPHTFQCNMKYDQMCNCTNRCCWSKTK